MASPATHVNLYHDLHHAPKDRHSNGDGNGSGVGYHGSKSASALDTPPPASASAHSDKQFASVDFSPAAYINWKADQQHGRYGGDGALAADTEAEVVSPADLAWQEASDVSSMIDEALGVTAAPIMHTSYQHTGLTSLSSNQHQHNTSTQATLRGKGATLPSPAGNVSLSPLSTGGPYSPTRQPSDMFCVKVLRAYSIADTLTGPNPYIVFDWGALGKASTHTVRNSTSPLFNSSLRFRSPATQGSSLADALMKSPPLQLILYTKNDSISDECLGYCSITDTSALKADSDGVIRIDLTRDGDSRTVSGTVEFLIEIM
jgi:hypothetical protein